MKRLAVLAAMGAMVIAPATANAQAIEIGAIPKCTQAVPGAVGLGASPVRLDVRVLLDGVSLARGQQIVSDAQRAYSPLGLSINASYASVSFSGTDSASLIAQAKSAVGGARPAGIDMVYGLTTKDMTSGGSNAVAGQADCIGGVAYADSAFAVGEDVGIEKFSILGIKFFEDLGAKTLAHELGHLLGAHHHYANCVEAVAPSVLESRGDVCTMMFNDLSAQRLQFSTLNSAVVRGHAQLYAQ